MTVAKPALPLILCLLALPLAACGGDSSDSGSAPKQASPAKAAQEAKATATALRQGLATYRKGDRKAAVEQVSNAYLDHFEIVEGPLGDADQKLNLSLEERISGTLRTKMTKGTPAEVNALANGIFADLKKAEAALR